MPAFARKLAELPASRRAQMTTRGLAPWLALMLALAAAAPALAQYSITGTVTGPGPTPVPAVELRLFTAGGTAIGIPPTFTGAGGAYAIAGLPSGSYLVEFRPAAATHLLAARLPVTISGAAAVLNAPLEAGVLLSGHVRDANGAPIAAIDVQARDRRSNELVLTPNDDTDANGFYQVVLPPAEYDLEWRAVAAGSLPWIPVALREVVENDLVLDVTMVIGMFVSGRVTDTAGTPLGGVNLDFTDEATGAKALTPGDVTAADGTFTARVPTGIYTVLAKPAPGVRSVAGELAGVVIGGNLSGLDFALAGGAFLSGVVTGPGGLPVEGADIDVTNTATGAAVPLAWDVTDVTGAYQVVVPTGSFDVVFSPPVATVLPCSRAAAVGIATDTVLNRALPAGALLLGSVTSGGLPVAGVDIDVIDPVTGADQPLVDEGTGATGAFQTVVPLGTWHVEVEPPFAAGLVAQRILNRVVAGTTSVPVSLAAGVRVTGTVRSALGATVANVDVDAHRMSDLAEMFTPGDHTDALGTYRLVLPAGNYRLVFKPGAPYAPADSVTLDDRAILVETVIDATLPGASAVGAGEGPPRGGPAGLGAHPNPFNPLTRVRFSLAEGGHGEVAIVGLDGRRLRTLASGALAAGSHEYAWDGRDAQGRALPSGTYLAVVRSGAATGTAKLVLLK